MRLTPRQYEVIERTVEGKSQSEIAAELGLSFSGVRSHRHAAYKKLEVHNTAQAVVRMQEVGWLVRPKAREEPEPKPPLSEGWMDYLAGFDRLLRARHEDVEPACVDLAVLFAGAVVSGRSPVPTAFVQKKGPREVSPGTTRPAAGDLRAALPNLEAYRETSRRLGVVLDEARS